MSFAAPFINFCASSYQRIRVAQHPPLPRVHGAALGGGYALYPLPALAAPLLWQTTSGTGIFN